MAENKVKSLVSAEEHSQISRTLLIWLNQYADKPVKLNFEFLPDDEIGMALSTIQATYKTNQYIDGSYRAQYQFKIIYRHKPVTNDDRLAADEMLNAMASWAEAREDKPVLGTGKNVLTIRRDAAASLYARYDDGSEDTQILMTMRYEVI